MNIETAAKAVELQERIKGLAPRIESVEKLIDAIHGGDCSDYRGLKVALTYRGYYDTRDNSIVETSDVVLISDTAEAIRDFLKKQMEAAQEELEKL